jgi:hypothetical protein
MIEIKHFNLSEFDSKTSPGSGERMRMSTLLKLDKARELYGSAIVVNHAFRTKADATRIMKNYPGAVRNSAHELGYAVDVRPESGLHTVEDWTAFLECLYAAGFRRFGIMAGAVHVDDDPARSFAMWDYTSTKPNVWLAVNIWWKSKTK